MRPTQHLADVVHHSGSGNATTAIREVLARGVFVLEERKREKRIAEKGTDQKLNPYISDAGKCIRAVTYSLMNVEESEPFTVDSLVNFLVGHSVEDAFAAILEAAGATVLREERASLKAGNTIITGRKDFSGVQIRWSHKIAELLGAQALEIPDGSTVELKATNSRAIAFLLKRGDGRDEHKAQLNLYLKADDETIGFLVYVVKDATKGEPIAHAWAVEYDDVKASDNLHVLAFADELAKRGELPSIPDGMKQGAFPCTYCNYRTRCWLEASIETQRAEATS